MSHTLHHTLCEKRVILVVIVTCFLNPIQCQDDVAQTTSQVIISRGFGYELHHASSADGFQNALHRILNPNFSRYRSAVLLVHGVLGNSNNFLIDDASGFIDEPVDLVGANIGFELAKRGHDVWLLDERATPFSANNTFYSRDQYEYWDWSLDEIALLDLPAAIDYIRSSTGRQQIGYIGHSQGTTVLFMLLSRYEKYNNMIKPFVALGPIFYTADFVTNRVPIIRNLPFDEVESVLKILGGPLINSELDALLRGLCSTRVSLDLLCAPIALSVLLTSNIVETPVMASLNVARILAIASSGITFTISSRQVAHYMQLERTNRPQMLDYTPEVNNRLYGTPFAPLYLAERITNKYIALFSAVNDVGADRWDVNQLRQTLRVGMIYDHVITDPSFSHFSFIFGEPEKLIAFVVKPVIDLMDVLY